MALLSIPPDNDMLPELPINESPISPAADYYSQQPKSPRLGGWNSELRASFADREPVESPIKPHEHSSAVAGAGGGTADDPKADSNYEATRIKFAALVDHDLGDIHEETSPEPDLHQWQA